MKQEIQVGGRKRTFLLITNGQAAVAQRIAAVLIVLHGSNQTGQSVRAFAGNSFDRLAAAGRVAVVYPDGLKKRWNHNKPGHGATDDVAFLAALADHFHASFGPVPVIVVGFSNGGQLAIRLVHEIPAKLHGAAIVGATLPRPGGLVLADKSLPLPVMLVHGTGDFVVPYGGEGWFASLLGGRRGPSAFDTAKYFAARNNITAEPTSVVLPHRRESGKTSVTLTRFEQGPRPPVWLYTVVGGGHVVPNRHRKAIFVAGRTTQDIGTAEALAEFFPVLRG
ncbi:alpha/beta hydrolase family esterase [Specibacter sp. AOP5-B1-6]|uniref:alpha/beta hydrolase family esterase n=1 Tax=Specibacter sp. AOP5-B1-6 TaxID=3457653 RepID=UPI003FBA1491